MMKRKFLLAVALCSAMPALPSVAAADPLGSTWADVTKLPDFFTGNWQSVTTFLDNPNDVPLTPKAKEHVKNFKPIKDIPFAGKDCKTPGMPIIQRLGSPLKFFYEPGLIAIYIENSSMTRFIKLNGKHAERPNPSYLGDSIGHFEGDTLVVESTAFGDTLFQYSTLPGQGTGRFVLPPEVTFGPHGPDMKMVERIRLIDPDTLEIQLTIYDDTVFTKPYVSKPIQIFKRNRGAEGLPHEWVCSSGDIFAFDPDKDETVEEDPAVVLERLKKEETK
ncbi:hypothetical protein WSK_4190 [Novosphingobium sp. Rr 2-17]|uniref:hypothetical protein n=1 Tax=Novosphingobium sp. Rr 2-17 TaxID=555793 RepID=UPI000269A586|nr:hypothetical protein [Novosphingobium sp. Rr 2-17]EIZ77198.1 hypothetical protein WSK_4190 [Novosphingobium sp. Rr 2-17]